MNHIATRIALMVFVIGCATAHATLVSAQSAWPLSIEITLGPAYTNAREPNDYMTEGRRGVRAGLLLGVPVSSFPAGRVVVAADVGAQGRGAYEDKLICYGTPDGGCRPAVPDFRMLSLLAGWETSGRSLRAIAGPVYIHENGRGLHGRLDFAAPLTGRLAFTAGLRGVLADYRDHSFQLLALGLGIRIQ